VLIDILLVLAGLAILIGGAESLVRGSSAIATRLNISPVVIGLTVVAFGTSAPELVISLKSVLVGSGDIALGNVVGSNISNIGLILGVAALIYPLNANQKLIKTDGPLLIYMTLVFLFFVRDNQLERWEGFALFVMLIAYLVFSFWKAQINESPEVLDELELAIKGPTRSVWLEVFLTVLGLAGLVIGGDWLVDGAVSIARSLDISEAVIGLTMVAIGTSLPELATSAVAAIRKETDIALGNVIGSNMFNLLGVMGAAATILPIQANDISSIDLTVMLVYSVILLPVMFVFKKITRPVGLVFLITYIGYIFFIVR
jgi:cation:H+ antiporter